MKKLRINPKIILTLIAVMTVMNISACGAVVDDSADNGSNENFDNGRDNSISDEQEKDALASESADDGEIDFDALKGINQDIFGWIYIPGENVDQPILQNAMEEDDYYSKHDAYGESNSEGAAYTEFPNDTDFCDFNEVIYGVNNETLLKYKDPDYFNRNREIEVFVDGDHMTYQVVMARDWDKVDLLTQYAFSIGIDCENFLIDARTTTTLSDNVADEFDDISFQDFLITLVAEKPEDNEKQFIVIGRLIRSDNGTIKQKQGEIPGIEF